MFRKVLLPEATKGKMFLHSLPGRYEPWEQFECHIKKNKINRIVCLAEAAEIERKSPSYSCAIRSGTVPCPKLDFPIPDFDIPSDRKAFAEFVRLVAQHIESGEKVLIHCAGGIGRTGTFAACVLHCLGFEEDIAGKLVNEAGPALKLRNNTILLSGMPKMFANERLCNQSFHLMGEERRLPPGEHIVRFYEGVKIAVVHNRNIGNFINTF